MRHLVVGALELVLSRESCSAFSSLRGMVSAAGSNIKLGVSAIALCVLMT